MARPSASCRCAGRGLLSSYYNDERGAGHWQDGWFRTGDVVTIDPEGYMQIVDRTKDLVKSGGEWISSRGAGERDHGAPARCWRRR